MPTPTTEPEGAAPRGREPTPAPRTPAPAPAARTPAPAPAPGTSPGAAAAGAAAPAAPAPLSRRAVKTALLAPDQSLADIADPLVNSLVSEGITQAQLDTRFAAPTAIKAAIIQKWCTVGTKPQAVKRFALNDPIATQKFADVDAEAYLDAPSLKVDFYNAMHTEIQAPGVDRTRVYPLMKKVTFGGAFTFRGRTVPGAEVAQFSSRNQSVATMYGQMTPAAKLAIDAIIRAELIKEGVPVTAITPAMLTDENRRRKAFRHWLKTQPLPHKAVEQSLNLSDYPTWYHPGHIKPTAPAGGLAYNQMMTLGALQPEWYPEGTATLNITKGAAAARELRKPTAFDGMASAVWVARNQPGQTYGVTGGGAGEFLEKDVKYSDVTASTVSIRSDDFVDEIKALAATAKALNSSVMEETLRGNAVGTSESTHLHQRITDRTTREAHTPGDTPVTGAPVGASPGAAVVGGTYDRSRQTPVR